MATDSGPDAHAAPETIANAAEPESDEFGLPIRRFVTPMQKPADADCSASCTQQSAIDAPDKLNQPKSHQASCTPALEGQAAVASQVDSDSDDAPFEDAQPAFTSAEHHEQSSSHASPLKAQGDAAATPKPTSADSEPPALPTPAASTKDAQLSADRDAETASSTREANVDKTPRPPETSEPVTAHSRDTSATSNSITGLGISEFSHQRLSMQHDKLDPEDDLGWQTMPSYARYDMYDDDDRLIAREHNVDEDEADGYSGLGGAGKGYTRVIMDEDAQSATSMDENTQYLFKEANGTSAMGEDEGRDAVAQMQATKDLLTEGQRIAYVGVVRLEIFNMVKEAEAIESTKKTKKDLATSAEAIKMWGQKMMIRLYAHMDISEAEQVMIEQLAEHGVRPADLTPALHANSRVHNPMAEEKEPSGKGQQEASSPLSTGVVDEQAAEPLPPYEGLGSSEVPQVQTPSQMPTTEKIDIDLRWTILCDLFLLLIADSIYDARSRVLLERVGASIEITWIDICRFEKRITDALEMQQAAEKENWNEDEHMESRRKMAQKRRYVMMGLATVGGGLVIGLSAGLLAPVIGAGLAAGFTTIGVTGTSSFLAGAGGAAIITSSAAASGSIIGVRAANRRTGAVKTFEYRPLHNNKRVNLIVTVSGWLTGKVDDVRLPFSTVDPIMGDIYSVLWEPEMLRSMGDTINILATEALTQGLQQILGSTILISLMAALQLPIVLTKLSYLIDNPWAVSLDRATAAGLILADSLLERSLGTRPITLVGYSLGARVIFSCMQELAKKGAYGLIQNVYMFGSPIVVRKEEYLRARTIVSGRFVNGYNRNDWILGYLFRLTNGGIRRVAGLAAIEDCPWMENIDVSELVAGHMEYRKAMPTLLMKCGWMVESDEFTEIEDPDPDNHQERQRELINEIEEARKELERGAKTKKASKFALFGRRKKAERQEWEVYEDSAGKENKASSGDEGTNTGVLFDIDAIRAELAKEAAHRGEVAQEELQVREIKSTLPPMKLDMASSSSSTLPLACKEEVNTLRETRSAEAVSSSLRHASAGWGADDKNDEYGGEGEEEIDMVFDTSFEPRHGEEAGKPSMWAAQTVPNVTLADPWADEDEDFGKEQEISMTFA
ncbi:hypothetical protein CDD81_1701 [Ophiocordyceps australis]|uniref:DUF726 domain protein n=1 Tax=Ophiocordyceps australis TaxID=1399860 RepID=A0A2C5XF72_9HYPO|nr:hypothetical protein CDD81_1701 [Ophiocordyceps australis]